LLKEQKTLKRNKELKEKVIKMEELLKQKHEALKKFKAENDALNQKMLGFKDKC